jgi:hypothetical protein
MRQEEEFADFDPTSHSYEGERGSNGGEGGLATQYITLNEATKLIPGRDGRRISLKSVHRWCRKGLRSGVRLRSELVGGKRCTTRRWLCEFFEALNREAESGVADRSVPRTTPQRQDASDRALQELKEAWGRKR